jgi:hypothetical protein
VKNKLIEYLFELVSLHNNGFKAFDDVPSKFNFLAAKSTLLLTYYLIFVSEIDACSCCRCSEETSMYQCQLIRSKFFNEASNLSSIWSFEISIFFQLKVMIINQFKKYILEDESWNINSNKDTKYCNDWVIIYTLKPISFETNSWPG